MTNKFQALVARYKRAQEGSVAILVGLSILVLILGAGTAVDMARAQILQTKIQAGLDAGGLASMVAINSVPVGYTQAAWVQETAQRYFDINFPTGYSGTTPISVVTEVVLAGTDTTVNLKAATVQSTSFMKIIGIDSVDVGAHSSVTRGSKGNVLELALVLDNTGSMNQALCATPPCGAASKLVALKDAVHTMMDILYGPSADTSPGLFVGLVPYSQTVNIGSGHMGWIQDTPPGEPFPLSGNSLVSYYDWGPGGSWGGCVKMQSGAGNETQITSPNTAPFGLYWYAPDPAKTQAAADAIANSFIPALGYYTIYNPKPVNPTATWAAVYGQGWRNDLTAPPTYRAPLNRTQQGPNLGCPSQLTEMTDSKSVINNAVDAMVATGDTVIPEGLIWGWRLIAPEYLGAWGGFMNANNLPLDYTAPNSKKYVILMTDGWNHIFPYSYSSNGYAQNVAARYGMPISEVNAEKSFDNNAKIICDRMKTKHITIYTIGFGTYNPANAGATIPGSINEPLLKYCATDADHYIPAATNDALRNAFARIASELTSLRVSQ